MDSWDFKYHASVFLSHVLVSCFSYHNIIFCLFFKTCKITSRYRRFLAIHKTNLLTKQTKSTLTGEREMDRYIGCFLEEGASSVFHTCNMTSLVASPPSDSANSHIIWQAVRFWTFHSKCVNFGLENTRMNMVIASYLLLILKAVFVLESCNYYFLFRLCLGGLYSNVRGVYLWNSEITFDKKWFITGQTCCKWKFRYKLYLIMIVLNWENMNS